MRRMRIIYLHGETAEGLEKAIEEGKVDLELGEIAVVTGGNSEENGEEQV